MNQYQIEAREYACPSCLMNYGAKAGSYEDAALQVYTKYYDPKGSHLSAISWDARKRTLNTDLGVYLEVREINVNVESEPDPIVDASMWHAYEHEHEEENNDESEEFTEDVWLG